MDQISQYDSEGDSNVSISLKKKAFVDFVLNFLGKKEKLIFELSTFDFVLNPNDIEQFYFLVNEKISREQSVSIDHFLSTISYHDNTSREISGIDSLQKFVETRYVIPQSISLTWNIVIQFPSAETLENQLVELTFNTDGGVKDRRAGNVLLTISHTNQAWGNEVLNLLKDKIQDVSIPFPKPAKFARKLLKMYKTTVFLPMLFMLITTIAFVMYPLHESKKFDSSSYYTLAEKVSNSQNANETLIAILAVHEMDSTDIAKTSENLISTPRLKETLKTISKENLHKQSIAIKYLASGGSFIVLVLISWLYLEKVLKYYGFSSHILLTKRASSDYAAEIANKNKTEFYSLTFCFVAITLSIISSIIFQIIIER